MLFPLQGIRELNVYLRSYLELPGVDENIQARIGLHPQQLKLSRWIAVNPSAGNLRL